MVSDLNYDCLGEIKYSCSHIIVQVFVDVPERLGRASPPRSVRIGLTTVQDSQIVMVLNLNQKVQIRQIVLRKQILKEVPNMDCFASYRVDT